MLQILKIIGYGVGMGILLGLVFFIIGMFFESDSRSTETVLKYDKKNKQYKEKNVINEEFSGNTTAYFAMAGIVIGIIIGVMLAIEKDTSSPKTSIVPSEENVKKSPPKIP
ncbi:MAG: hypothetical protein OHK0045_03960 [Raineya sp.]